MTTEDTMFESLGAFESAGVPYEGIHLDQLESGDFLAEGFLTACATEGYSALKSFLTFCHTSLNDAAAIGPKVLVESAVVLASLQVLAKKPRAAAMQLNEAWPVLVTRTALAGPFTAERFAILTQGIMCLRRIAWTLEAKGRPLDPSLVPPVPMLLGEELEDDHLAEMAYDAIVADECDCVPDAAQISTMAFSHVTAPGLTGRLALLSMSSTGVLESHRDNFNMRLEWGESGPPASRLEHRRLGSEENVSHREE